MSMIDHGIVGPIPKPFKRAKNIIRKRRATDRRAKLKAEPARWDGKRQCYLCTNWFTHVDLEHVIDASIRPDLRHDPSNHRWACNPCNIKKKLGM